jgi:CHAT domain-containing protein
MNVRQSLGVGLLTLAGSAGAVDLPPVCADYPAEPDDVTPLPELRARAEALLETDPPKLVALMCATIPRVEREQGTDSAELAWWVGSLATPLIAYLDRYDEALPLLDFALPLYRSHLGPDAAEVADVHVAHAWIDFRRGRLEDAGDAWERALAVRERNPGPGDIELQKVLVGLAQVRLSQRDFESARAALDRASAILTARGESVSEAAAAIENAYTNLALRQENYPRARVHAERQIAIEQRLAPRSAQLVSANVVLAQVLEQLDEYEAAEAALRTAIGLAEANGDAPLQRHHLTALTQLAATLNERGKPREAAGFADRAVALGEATLGSSEPRLVRVLDVRAAVHHALGRLSAALADYRHADHIVVAHPGNLERQTLVAHHRGKGALLAALGDPLAARDELQRAIEVAGGDATLGTERAHALVAMASLNGVQSDNRRRARLLEARTLLGERLPDTHPDILRVANELCALEIQAPYAPACDDAAARLARAHELEPALTALVLGNQSRRAQARGDSDDAFALAVDALATAAALATPDPQWQALARLAELLEARAEGRLAIFFGKQSVVEIERLRSHLVNDGAPFERDFLADKTRVYRTVADWLFAETRIDEGLEVLGLLKTEELHDFFLRNGTNHGSLVGPSFSPAEERLLASYRALQSSDGTAGVEIDRLGRLRSTDHISTRESAELDALLTHQAGETRRYARSIRRWLADAALAGFTRPATAQLRSRRIDRIRDRFGDDTAFAAYLLTDSHLRTVVATRAGVEQHIAPVNAAALQRDIGRLLDAIGERRDATGPARALYAVLLEPVIRAASAAGARRLVLWPDGVLRYVPYTALHDGKRFVADAYPVQIYSAATSTATPSTATAAARADVIRGLGVTRAVGELKPLPAMAEELCSIIAGPILGLDTPSDPCGVDGIGHGVVTGEGYVDAMFTAGRLETLLDGNRPFDLLHLGTHFELRPGNALRSTLLLGDGSRLSLDEIGRLDFRGLELVTLSACQTGMGGGMLDDGREVEGLSAVVQRRGARRVIASLWSVEDASTARLMHRFYGALMATGGDAAQALSEAGAALRATDSYRHPYYWAGFFVSGDTP